MEKYTLERTQLEPNLCRFQLARPIAGDMPIRVGDLVSWRGRGGSVLNLFNCADMIISGVTIRNGTGFAFKEEFGEGNNHYDHITVTYGDRPAGATEKPLLSCSSDAFHSRSVRRGPTVESFLFEGMDDDGFAVHCFYAMVVKSAGDRIVIDWRHPAYRVGDVLRFLDSSRALAAQAKVVAIRRLPEYQNNETPPKNVAKEFNNPKFLKNATFYEVTLDHPIPAKLGWLVADVSATGNGFVVRNGTIRRHRARSFLIKAGDGLIENCTVEEDSMGALIVSPEASGWDEGDYSQNLTIRNNTFRHCSITRGESLAMAGIVSIAAYECGQFVPAPGGHRNIVIQNNTFEDNTGVQILVSSAKGVKLIDNRFIKPMLTPSVRGEAKGVDPTALIWVTQSDQVELSGNIAIKPGPYFRTFLKATDTTNGKGFDTGIKAQ